MVYFSRNKSSKSLKFNKFMAEKTTESHIAQAISENFSNPSFFSMYTIKNVLISIANAGIERIGIVESLDIKSSLPHIVFKNILLAGDETEMFT